MASPSLRFLLHLVLHLLLFQIGTTPVVCLLDHLLKNNGWPVCEEPGNYTANSTFQSSLNLLFTSLSNNTPPTGFSNDTAGVSGPQAGRIYGLALCRGDKTPDECRSCLDMAVKDIRQYCPLKRSVTTWYDDCLLRYNDTNFFTVSAGYQWPLYNPNKVSPNDTLRFNEVLVMLLNKLANQAAFTTPRMFATAEANVTTSSKIYGLVQCTRDLSTGDCYSCLKDEIRFAQSGRIGARFLGGSCWVRYESGPFYNSLPSTVAPIPSPAAPPPPTTENNTNTSIADASGGKKKSQATIIAAVVVPVTAVLCLTFCAICICLRRKTTTKRRPYQAVDADMQSSDTISFDLEALKQATDNFSEENKLGEGGFGPVYKGVLEDGQEVAVKRLAADSAQGLVELRNEVLLVAKLQHRNLVRLLGFSLQEKEMLLVYEYLSNTSLDRFLFDPIKSKDLDWATRYKIIEGISRGLLYLHEDSRLKVIHRDLKVSNILLDSSMTAKISDFGLAKLFGGEETQGATKRIAGTYGYMSPEYALYGQFSTKSDAYSFGVVVLEIVTGQKCSALPAAGKGQTLISYVWKNWSEGTVAEVVDQNLEGNCSMEQVVRCIHIALLCVQEDPSERPLMSTVVLMLSSLSATLPVPAVLAWERKLNNVVVVVPENQNYSDVSQNECSVTELNPR